MATKKTPATGNTAGLALVDIPAFNLKAGDHAELPAEVAQALADSGEFDPKAPAPAAE